MMPRVSNRGGSYGHHARRMYKLCDGHKLIREEWRITWIVDSVHRRVRYPHVRSRETDRAGVERFAKRWGLKIDDKEGTAR